MSIFEASRILDDGSEIAGDQTLGRFIEINRDGLLAYAYKLMGEKKGAKGKQYADDVFQDTVVECLGVKNFDFRSDPETWGFVIRRMRWQASRIWRQRKRIKETTEQYALSVNDSECKEKFVDDRIDQIKVCLEKLPEHDRAVVQGCVDSKSLRDYVGAIGENYSKIRARWQRAIKKLRDCVLGDHA